MNNIRNPTKETRKQGVNNKFKTNKGEINMNTLDFMNFVSTITEDLSRYGKDEFTCEVKEVKGAIALVLKYKNDNVSPVFYLEKLYNEYKEGKSIIDITEHLKDQIDNKPHFKIADYIEDFDKVKDRLFLRIFHKDNISMYEENIHKTFDDTDFVIVPYIKIDKGARAAITPEMFEAWYANDESLTEDHIIAYAYRNIDPNDIIFKSLTQTVMGALEPDYPEMDFADDPMHVMMDEEMKYGAATILSKKVREMIAALIDDDYYVILSSVHECLIISKNSFPADTDLINMVKEVNDNVVDQEEIASYKVFEVTNDNDYDLISIN